MSVKDDILTIGFDKNGEAEFGVRCTVCYLTYQQMKELRAMIPVAIGAMEQMWRDEQMKNPEHQGTSNSNSRIDKSGTDAPIGILASYRDSIVGRRD